MHFQKIIQFVLPILYILATIQPKKKKKTMLKSFPKLKNKNKNKSDYLDLLLNESKKIRDDALKKV